MPVESNPIARSAAFLAERDADVDAAGDAAFFQALAGWIVSQAHPNQDALPNQRYTPNRFEPTFSHDYDERFSLLEDSAELHDLLRRIVFKTAKPYWLSNAVLAEHFDDLYQTAWAKLLELKSTHYDAPKGSVIARVHYTVRRYLEHQIFGWQPPGGHSKRAQLYRLVHFYQFMPEAIHGEYDLDELGGTLYGQLSAQQPAELPSNPEELLCQREEQRCGFDQWVPTLEDDLYTTIAAGRLYRAPHQRLFLATIRRQAFMLTARLRGMQNVDIALATGRHSDRTKARQRVGSDVSAARTTIDAWLALDKTQRCQALETLQERYPALSAEPLAYGSLNRELFWGKAARDIDDQADKG